MEKKKIVIIGGGFAGIGCAVALLKEGHDVTIIEAEDRLGGLAFSFEKNGKQIHTGYHQILSTDKPLLWLFKELDQYERIKWKKCAIRFRTNKMSHDLMNPLHFLRFPIPLDEKIRFVFFMLRCFTKKDWTSLENISAESWIKKEVGKKTLDALFAPLIDIKFGLKASEVSAAWVGSRLGSREGSSGFGCIPGHEWTYELCKAAAKRITELGGKIQYNARVNRIVTKNGQATGVIVGKKTINADVVVSTLAPPLLLKLVDLKDPSLENINYIDSISTIVSTPKTKQNFYWLICLQPRRFIGGLFNLTDLNPTLGTNREIILNFFTNVTHNDASLKLSDQEIINQCTSNYKDIYGTDIDVNWYKVNRIPFVSAKYVKGYKNPNTRTKIKGLYLAGNFMSYPSVTSTGTALDTGVKAARAVLKDQ